MPIKKVEITESLFAHINTDAFLVGSVGLEGQVFENTINYLKQYIRQLEQQGALTPDVEHLLTACEGLVERESQLGQCASAEDLSRLAHKIYADISKLSGEQYLLMPGGWESSTGGHAMIYQFRLGDNGDLLFCINNSGDGLQYHEKYSTKDKELYNPVLTYKIPKEMLTHQRDFVLFIQQLLQVNANVQRKTNADAATLYLGIFPKLSHLKGVIIADRSIPLRHWYTAGQLSGTCAQRSIHQMLKVRFSSWDKYRRFIYGFKVYALDDYIGKLRSDGDANNPKYLQHVIKAIKHNLRLLNLKSNSDPSKRLFSQSKVAAEREKLCRYKAELEGNATDNAAIKKMQLGSQIPLDHSIDIGLSVKIDNADGASTCVEMTMREPLTICGGERFLIELSLLLERCNVLKEERNDFALLQQLELFFLTLPLDTLTQENKVNTYYAAVISEGGALDFFSILAQLQNLYFDCIARLINKECVLPRMYLVKLSIFAVTAYINGRLSKLDAFKSKVTEYLECILCVNERSTFLATNEPNLDARLALIKRLYPDFHGNNHDSEHFHSAHVNATYVLKYYQSLIPEELLSDFETAYKAISENLAPCLKIILDRLKLGGIYYFLTNFHLYEDVMKSEGEYAELVRRFQLQFKMEAVYVSNLKLLAGESRYGYRIGEDSRPFIQIEAFELKGSSNIYLRIETYFNSVVEMIKQSKGLQHAKYPMSVECGARYALTYNINKGTLPRTDNNTQLVASLAGLNQHVIDAAQIEARELFHLRRVAATQIVLTIEYFNVHIEKLKRVDMQQYIEANLMQPELLLAAINATLLEQFDKFIEKGLTVTKSKGSLSQNSIVFIRLNCLLYEYIYLADVKQYQLHLNALIARLFQLIEITQDEDVQTSLHHYGLSLLVTKSRYSKLSEAEFAQAFLSFFIINARRNPDETLSLDSKLKMRVMLHNFKTIVEEYSKYINVALLTMVLQQANLHLDLAKANIDGGFPEYIIKLNDSNQVYRIHVTKGLIYCGELILINTPLNIMNHPYLQLTGFANARSCFVSQSGNKYLIERENLTLRISVDKYNQYIIERKFQKSDAAESWYSLRPLTQAQKSMFSLSGYSYLEGDFSVILKERDKSAWVSADHNEIIFTNRVGTICYRARKSNLMWRITTSCPKEYIATPKTAALTLCSSIEGSKFVIVKQRADKTEFLLARYGLSFMLAEDGQYLEFEYQGKIFKQTHRQLNFRQGVAALEFCSATQRLCVIAVQVFLNTGNRQEDSEYYQLEHDRSAKVCQHLVTTVFNIEPNQQLWQYSGTEQAYIMKIKGSQPIPETPAQALYLCYVYLASRQPEKAWKILEYCDKSLGGLTGAYDELRYIAWICNCIPYLIKEADSKATVSTPPYVSCKLKAIALLTRARQQSINFNIPDDDFELQNDNLRFRQAEIRAVMQFYAELSAEIYQLFSRWQLLHRELYIGYELTDLEKRSLLNYYYEGAPRAKEGKPALGALGYAWVQLHISILNKEYLQLVRLEAQRALSQYESMRKQAINAFINSCPTIKRTTSNIEYVSIDLELPEDVTINKSFYTKQEKEKAFHYRDFPLRNLVAAIPNQQVALEVLHSDCKEGEFIDAFPSLLTVALDNNHPGRATLVDFCKAVLLASRHVPLKKQHSNIPLLCNVLYRVLCSPAQTKIKVGSNIRSYSYLFTLARELKTTPIAVPQLASTFNEVLATSQQMWDELPQLQPVSAPTITADETVAIDSNKLLFTAKENQQFLAKESAWKALEYQHRTGKLPGDTKEKLSEQDAGKNKFTALLALQDLATIEFEGEGVRADLLSSTETHLAEIKVSQQRLLAQILDLAGEGPEDPGENQQWMLEIDAEQRSPVMLDKLLALYLHENMQLYAEQTGLSSEKINKLHGLLAQYIAATLRQQQLSRISNILLLIANDVQSESLLHQACYKLAQALYAENLVDVTCDTVLSIFQYYEEILLRPKQIESIKRLLETDERGEFLNLVMKIIMGGGKSKVFLPIVAQKMARGNNLVVIEVPRALLKTNYVDLKAVSTKLFAQAPVLFDFERYTDCSPQALRQYFNNLVSVMVNKSYLVTTGRAVPSLELKYFEVLLLKPNNEEEIKVWEEQVYWLDQLVNLFQNKADLVIDEVHQGLLLKNKLNYTLGEPKTLSKALIEHSVNLYRFLYLVKLDNIKGLKNSGSLTLADIIKNKKPFNNDAQFQQACELLARQLVDSKESPLAFLFKDLSEEKASQKKAALLLYLQNETDVIPGFTKKLTQKQRLMLQLYKLEVNKLLAFTLNKKHGENYGPSKSTKHSPAVRVVAKPYLANTKPNEFSDFGHPIVATNYTIQSLLISGIPTDLLKVYVEQLQVRARVEFNDIFGSVTDKRDASIDNVPVALFFAKLVAPDKILLSEIDVNDETQFASIAAKLKYKEELIFQILEELVLKNIRIDTKILHGDAYNHVDTVHSCRGVSATLANYETFHQKLNYDEDSSIGTDAYIINGIRDKQPNLQVLDFTELDAFIAKCFERYSAADQIRAIIDINATFLGVSNLIVAQKIASYIAMNPTKFNHPCKVEYVLFFDDQDRLAALSVAKDAGEQKVIVLNTSDPELINERLDCKPNARFTFYDQAHTIGADIKQTEQAKAIVFIDQETPLSSFTQGAMRMRDLLEGGQNIDIFVPSHLEGNSFDELIELMRDFELKTLQANNFEAAIAKMHAVIRLHLKRLILKADTVSEKHRLGRIFQEVFIDIKTESDFLSCSLSKQSVATKDILTRLEIRLFSQWNALTKEAVGTAPKDITAKVRDDLHEVVVNACLPGVCAEEQLWQQQDKQADVATLVEVEVQVEVEVKEEVEKELFDPELRELNFKLYSLADFLSQKKVSLATLKKICTSCGAEDVPDFSTNILASPNFFQCYKWQENHLGYYAKPVHALLFFRTAQGLQCILLSQQECDRLLPEVNQYDKAWISTTQHHCLAGKPEEHIELAQDYQLIIEQVRFFNGELSLLLETSSSLLWLADDTQQKVEFFHNNLLCSRECHASQLQQLLVALQGCQQVFAFIAMTADIDRTDFDWEAQFEDCEEEDIAEYKRVAAAFYHVSQNWWNEAQSIADLTAEYNLPLLARGHFSRHVQAVNCEPTHQSLRACVVATENYLTSRDNSDTTIDGETDIVKGILLRLSDAGDATENMPCSDSNTMKMLSTNGYIWPKEVELLIPIVTAAHPNISLPEVRYLTQYCLDEPLVVLGLLLNSSLYVDAYALTKVAEHDIDRQALVKLSAKLRLPESSFLAVLVRAERLEILQDILTVLVTTHDTVRATIIAELCQRTKESSTLLYFLRHATYIKDENVQRAILQNPFVDADMLDLLSVVCDESIMLEVLAHDFVSQQALENIFLRAEQIDVISAMVSKRGSLFLSEELQKDYVGRDFVVTEALLTLARVTTFSSVLAALADFNGIDNIPELQKAIILNLHTHADTAQRLFNKIDSLVVNDITFSTYEDVLLMITNNITECAQLSLILANAEGKISKKLQMAIALHDYASEEILSGLQNLVNLDGDVRLVIEQKSHGQIFAIFYRELEDALQPFITEESKNSVEIGVAEELRQNILAAHHIYFSGQINLEAMQVFIRSCEAAIHGAKTKLYPENRWRVVDSFKERLFGDPRKAMLLALDSFSAQLQNFRVITTCREQAAAG